MITPVPRGMTPTYLQFCREHRQEINRLFPPAPWDWLLGPEGMSRVGGSTPVLAGNEIVIPQLDRLIRRLREHTEVVLIDFLPQDVACLAFDDEGSPLANIVAGDAEEAALRALLLLVARRAGTGQDTG